MIIYPSTSGGAIPQNESENCLAIVTAGFAKLLDEQKIMAAVM